MVRLHANFSEPYIDITSFDRIFQAILWCRNAVDNNPTPPPVSAQIPISLLFPAFKIVFLFCFKLCRRYSGCITLKLSITTLGCWPMAWPGTGWFSTRNSVRLAYSPVIW